jgi:complement component 1 Q subcomponent-binding protein
MFAGRIVALAKAARPLVVRAAKATPVAFPKVVASVSTVRFNSTLADTLQKELKHEQGEQEVDQEFVDIKKLVLKSFKLHDHTGEGVVKLTREHKGEQIEVVFDCQDVEENEVEPENEQTEPEMDVGVNFEVIISKPSAHSKLVVQCLGTAEGTTIRNVRHLPAEKPIDDVDGYSGPTFDDLDGELQDEIAKYLEDRRIDSDFGYFVLAYATDKEQREYVNWLNKLHDFVSAK